MQLCHEVMELVPRDKVPEPDAERAEVSDAVGWAVTARVPALEECVYALRVAPNSRIVWVFPASSRHVRAVAQEWRGREEC